MIKKIVAVLLILASIGLYAQTIEVELDKISGKYSGSWTSYKYTPSGDIVKSMTWKDVVSTENPVIGDSMAYVTVKNTMTFDNPHIPPYVLEYQEGFDVSNGIIIDHFFTINGVKTIEVKVSDNTYIILQPITPQELSQLGFSSAMEAYHTTVKNILTIEGGEIQKITRISTVVWKDDSKIKTVQFVSLEGYHKKIEE